MAFSGSCTTCSQGSNTQYFSFDYFKGNGGAGNLGATPPEIPTQRARITVFFDGTGNNKTNVDRGKADKIPFYLLMSAYKSSYANDHSNISHLSTNCKELNTPIKSENKPYNFHKKIYLEGIGTTNNAGDSMIANATGMGPTGISAKVEHALDEAIKELTALATSYDVEFIHLDSFGFSRGAAAARYFIHEAFNNEDAAIGSALKKKNYVVNEVSFKFVGLFDTVASYGVDHDHDTAELSLTAISSAEQVIHFAAAEEHREKFRLTDIGSASGSDSLEVFLPGVHSDVGGGYPPNAEEDITVWEQAYSIYDRGSAGMSNADADIKREMNWLTEQGWFKSGELQHKIWATDSVVTHQIRAKRFAIANQYRIIPYNMMVKFASEKKLEFSANTGAVSLAMLKSLEIDLNTYVNKMRGGGKSARSSPDDWFHQTSSPHHTKVNLAALRNLHLHFSSNYSSIGMSPQWSGTLRKRIIQPG